MDRRAKGTDIFMAYSSPSSEKRGMIRPALLAVLWLTAALPASAETQRFFAGEEARAAREMKPYREIVDGTRRQMGGATLVGTDFDRRSGIYRLRFMRDGEVIDVDVDGRSGQIIGRSDR